jgi:hypothetical protein
MHLGLRWSFRGWHKNGIKDATSSHLATVRTLVNISPEINKRHVSTRPQLSDPGNYARTVIELGWEGGMSTQGPDVDVTKINDANSLRTLMGNARRLGREDVYWKAFGRLCALQGISHSDPLHREFAQTLAAYEELLITQKNARTTRASRTRQKIANKGVEQSLEDWAHVQATLGEADATLSSSKAKTAPSLQLSRNSGCVQPHSSQTLPHSFRASPAQCYHARAPYCPSEVVKPAQGGRR